MSQLPEAETAAEGHVLVYGCPRRRRTYRAQVPGPVPPLSASRTVSIPCPCGEEHSVLDIYARAPGESVDVVIAAEPNPAALEGRQKVSDAAILDALTAEPIRVAELADSLGFAFPNTLARRGQRMNARAVAKGEPPPIAVAGGRKAGGPLTFARPA